MLGTPPAVIAGASRDEQARVSAVLGDLLPISRRQAGLSLEGQLTTERLSKPLESMRVPILAISARDDLYGTWGNARFISDHVPDARLVSYPTGGQLLVGHNGEVIDTVIAFLRDRGWSNPGEGTPRSPRSLP